MMRKLCTVAVLFACIFFTIGIVEAADRDYYVGIDGVYAIESLDEQQTKDKFTGSIEVDFDNSWGVRLNGGWIINKYFTSEVMFEYVTPFEAKTGGNKDELDVMNLTLNGKFTCPAYEKFIPYVVAGVGAMNAYEDIVYNGATSKTRERGISFRAGIGADYYINECCSLKLEGAYVAGVGSVSHVRYTNIAFGIAYHF
jgi:opacity protein-like surface antigen